MDSSSTDEMATAGRRSHAGRTPSRSRAAGDRMAIQTTLHSFLHVHHHARRHTAPTPWSPADSDPLRSIAWPDSSLAATAPHADDRRKRHRARAAGHGTADDHVSRGSKRGKVATVPMVTCQEALIAGLFGNNAVIDRFSFLCIKSNPSGIMRLFKTVSTVVNVVTMKFTPRHIVCDGSSSINTCLVQIWLESSGMDVFHYGGDVAGKPLEIIVNLSDIATAFRSSGNVMQNNNKSETKLSLFVDESDKSALRLQLSNTHKNITCQVFQGLGLPRQTYKWHNVVLQAGIMLHSQALQSALDSVHTTQSCTNVGVEFRFTGDAENGHPNTSFCPHIALLNEHSNCVTIIKVCSFVIPQTNADDGNDDITRELFRSARWRDGGMPLFQDLHHRTDTETGMSYYYLPRHYFNVTFFRNIAASCSLDRSVRLYIDARGALLFQYCIADMLGRLYYFLVPSENVSRNQTARAAPPVHTSPVSPAEEPVHTAHPPSPTPQDASVAGCTSDAEKGLVDDDDDDDDDIWEDD